MPSIIRFLAVLIAFVALSPHSYSQTLDKGMAGFTKVGIIVVEVGQEARDCGVTETGLRSAASALGSPIRPVRLSSGPV